MAKKTGKKDGSFKINMKDAGEGFTPLEDGRHPVTVSECELTESSNGNPMLKFIFTVDGTSSKLYENCTLTPQSLWNLANVYRCLGLVVPKEETEYRADDFIGLQGEVETMAEKNQEGKTFPRIIQFYPKDQEDDSEDDDDDEVDLEEYLGDLEDEEVVDLAKALGIKVTKKSKTKDLVTAIMDKEEDDVWEQIDELFPDDDNEGDEEGEDDSDSETDDSEDDIDLEEKLSELETEDLKLIAEDLGVNIKKAKTDEAIIEKIMKEDEEDIIQSLKDAELWEESDDDSDDDDDDEVDYDEMDLEDLKQLCEDRGIKVAKKDKKKDLIKKLEEDDEDGDDD